MHMIQVIQINRKKNKGNKKGGGGRREHNEWKQTSSFFRLTFKESFRHGDEQQYDYVKG